MARVTVEDCIDKVDNRFELVLLASHRARLISQGAAITIDRDNDKNPVVALREIADETIDLDALRQGLIGGLQKHVEVDEPEEDNMAALMQSNDWAAVTASQNAGARDGMQMVGDGDDDGDVDLGPAEEA